MKKMYDEAEFKAAAHSFSAWMTEQSLPLWWKKGRLANGSFCEALDFCGDAIDSDESRVRVQARQLFCFSLAWNQGWRDGISADELERSAARFCSSCLRSDGLAGLRTNIRNGELINDSLDLYDNAFALLALSQSHAALQTAESLARMKKMFHAIASGLANQSSGGFLENVPPGAVRLQNPHMHLFESLLLAYQASDDQEILDELRTLYDFVNRTFFDTEQALVAERVPEGSREAAQSFEPGHSMEWVWLLGYYARMTGSQ